MLLSSFLLLPPKGLFFLSPYLELLNINLFACFPFSINVQGPLKKWQLRCSIFLGPPVHCQWLQNYRTNMHFLLSRRTRTTKQQNIYILISPLLNWRGCHWARAWQEPTPCSFSNGEAAPMRCEPECSWILGSADARPVAPLPCLQFLRLWDHGTLLWQHSAATICKVNSASDHLTLNNKSMH